MKKPASDCQPQRKTNSWQWQQLCAEVFQWLFPRTEAMKVYVSVRLDACLLHSKATWDHPYLYHCVDPPPSLLELHRVITVPSFFSGSLKGCGKSEEAVVSYIWVKYTLLLFMFNEYFCSRKKESRPMLQGQKFICKERNRLKISEAKREAQEWD